MTEAGAGGIGALRRLLVHGPRGNFRWSAYVLAVTSFAAAIPTPFYPSYERSFGFTNGTLGLVFAAYTPGVLLPLLLLAPGAERTGRRRALVGGMLLVVLSAGIFAAAAGVLWLALGRAVAGLAVGCTTSVATASMSDLEPDRDQHHVARVAVGANFGGFALGVLLSGLVAQYLPEPARLVYLAPVALALVGLLAVGAIPETAAAAAGTVDEEPPERIEVPTSLTKPFAVAAGGIAACYSIYGLFAALVPSFIRESFAVAAPLASAGGVALMFGAAALTQLATAQVRDRRALLFGFPALIVSLAALVLVLPLGSWPLLAIVTAGLGIGVGLTFMGSQTLIDRIAPERLRGEMLAGYYSVGYLSLAVPTIGVAESSDRIGLTQASVVFGAVVAVATAGLFLLVLATPTPPGGGGRPRARPRAPEAGSGTPPAV